MEKKQCNTCKEWKDLDCFSKNKNGKDGHQNKCKECVKKYNKKWYQENKEECNKKSNKWYQENKEYHNKIRKEYYKINKKNELKTNKKYREDNKEKELKRGKKYREDNKEKIKEKYNSPVKFNNKSKIREEIELYEEVRESEDGYLQCKCAYCGDWFIPTYNNIRGRLNAINGDNRGEGRLYCSEVCKQACPTYKQLLYPKGFKEATSREVQPELRQMVLARDNYTCQRCNKHKDELDVALHCHHLEGIQWEPLESADINQCITYCQTCHIKAHQTPDCGYHDMKCNDI